DPAGEGARLARRGVERGRRELDPNVARGDVDCGVLPDPSDRAGEPADVEAVEADEFARSRRVDVAGLERCRSLGLGWRGVPRDEAEAVDPPRQPVAAEDAPDAVGADDDPAP